jgi:hypothetical protein
VRKQERLPVLKGHAACCTIQSSRICTEYQIKRPVTKSVTDPKSFYFGAVDTVLVGEEDSEEFKSSSLD